MRGVDLFAGCGGLSRGFQDAGISIVAAYDAWEVAVDCYRENNPDCSVFCMDLSDIPRASQSVGEWAPDIVIGGPPCQDFSHAGKRSEGERADLTVAFAQIVSNVRPKWFVYENVDRARKSEAYLTAREIFREAGYGLVERMLDASLCGVPQKRRRFFCIGHIGENDGFMDPIITRNLASKPLTVREYLGREIDVEYYYRHPRNYNRRGIFSIDEPSPTIRGVNRPVPQGYLGHRGDPVPVSPTLRPLTTLERARIQTFPLEYQWIGSRTDVEQMVGDAVPVKLAKFIARAIQEYVTCSDFLAG